jgi:hypothetical protein
LFFREILDSSQALTKYEGSDTSCSKKLITIPGEFYPEENLSMIHTPISVEPCCGTHVFNTADIQVNTFLPSFIFGFSIKLGTNKRKLGLVQGSQNQIFTKATFGKYKISRPQKSHEVPYYYINLQI